MVGNENKYAECAKYLRELGMPKSVCERAQKKYEKNQDIEGLMNYVLLCEAMVESCVD